MAHHDVDGPTPADTADLTDLTTTGSPQKSASSLKPSNLLDSPAASTTTASHQTSPCRFAVTFSTMDLAAASTTGLPNAEMRPRALP
jgi:hypothetical protein